MFQVVLSNKDHMEYGVVTVPFPIPEDQYDDITRMLEALHIGSELSPDCQESSLRWLQRTICSARILSLKSRMGGLLTQR